MTTVPSTVPHFTFHVPGPVRGQGRPRTGINKTTGRPVVFTDAKTRSYAQQVQTEWIDAGRPQLPPGPYRLIVVAFMARPKHHYLTGGGLSAAGNRAGWYPTAPPDVDNVVKLVCDALMAVGAIPDDAALVDLRAGKQYVSMVSDRPYVSVRAESLLEGGKDLLDWVRPVAEELEVVPAEDGSNALTGEPLCRTAIALVREFNAAWIARHGAPRPLNVVAPPVTDDEWRTRAQAEGCDCPRCVAA